MKGIDIQHAQDFMLKYFQDGEIYTPGQIETEIMGISPGRALSYLAMFNEPIFNGSSFGKALSNLVKLGTIIAWQIANREWRYATRKTFEEKFGQEMLKAFDDKRE